MDPDYSLTSECAAGPGFTLHSELPLFLWFRDCTMVEMQLFGLAYEKNILASFRDFGSSPAPQQGRRLSPGFALLRLWALLGTAGAGSRSMLEHTFLVSARTGASWEGQSRAGLDLGRAGLCSPAPIPSRGTGTSERLHARPCQPSLFCHPSPPSPPFFSLYCHQCPQGVGHEICADWRDPEGNCSAGR